MHFGQVASPLSLQTPNAKRQTPNVKGVGGAHAIFVWSLKFDVWRLAFGRRQGRSSSGEPFGDRNVLCSFS